MTDLLELTMGVEQRICKTICEIKDFHSDSEEEVRPAQTLGAHHGRLQ